MFEGLGRWLRRGKGSRTTVKNRLQLILIQDRTGVAPEILDALRDDMFQVISKYFIIQEDDVEMTLESDDDAVALVANIPVLKLKRQPSPSR
ncbi:cell division topological specificity factor MinE [Candidatus Poribacteria bacterium]